MILAPEVETRSWEEQLALDDRRYRTQLAYLLERSAFYRQKLTAAGLRAIELLRPQAAVLTPSYAAHLVESAAQRGADLRGSSVTRVLVAGEPGGGEAAFRARLEDGWGAKVTEAMGIGDIGVSLWGECDRQDGMHLGARDFVHVELVDPASGQALALENGATGELVLTHLQHRAAPLLRSARETMSRFRRVPARAGGPARACAASGEPTTC